MDSYSQKFFSARLIEKTKKEMPCFEELLALRTSGVLITESSRTSVFSRSTFNRSPFSPLSRRPFSWNCFSPFHGYISVKVVAAWISKTQSIRLHRQCLPFSFFFVQEESERENNIFIKVRAAVDSTIVLCFRECQTTEVTKMYI